MSSAHAYQADGQIKKAVELLQYVVGMHTRRLTEEHPDLLSSQHELAHAYQADGQIKKAVELLEHVVTVRRQYSQKSIPNDWHRSMSSQEHT